MSGIYGFHIIFLEYLMTNYVISYMPYNVYKVFYVMYEILYKVYKKLYNFM